MSKVKITTLSSVHIGSGDFLQQNTDFVFGTEGEEEFLYVVDPKKILNVIGSENIENWLLSIERKEDTKLFVSRYVKNITPVDYSERKILNFATIRSTDTLKECIHNGMGFPYIPGSSIKGAIRTAVLATYSDKINNPENKIKDFKGKVSAKQIEGELFGKDPNKDIFRFIQVGDAYFDTDTVISTKLINLNITSSDSLIDKKKSQLVEAIRPNVDSFLQIKVNKEQYEWVSSHQNSNVGTLYEGMSSLPKLFKLINQYTKKLVNEEIEYWKDADKTGGETYVENMQTILNEINSCKEGECVLRLGHASGWRFITGAWTEYLDNFFDVVVESSRPNNSKFYKEYDFPKSRRLDEDSDILGFVKMCIS